MRIAYLMPGSGGSFYCENCLRDADLVRALRAMGHDPLLVPLYLPLGAEAEEGMEAASVFFGGVNVFLQQKCALFRRTPRWVDRVFDAQPLLKLAARMAGMTDAETLAETTLSMLRGEHGRQAKELDRLVGWLAEEQRPDLACLSNALLLGAARRLRAELGCPVVCSLQDEDIFLDALPDPARQEAWAAVAERAADADAFVAVSRYYAERMRRRLGLAADRLHVVHNAIAVERYSPAPAPPARPTIGFLERLCSEKGLDLLVEAFVALKSRPAFRDLRLRVAGGWTAADRPFVDAARRRLADAGVAGDVEMLGNLERRGRADFLASLSVLSVPARHAEAFGAYVLEALACEVPVVVPRRGAFPELLEATGGGVLCEAEDAESLAAALAGLLSEPRKAQELGRTGRAAVAEKFTVQRMARQCIEVYDQAVARSRAEAAAT
ncbi:MAG: glycosyltransferase family 4 protein [Candidatus Brocadiia bacterium]